MALSEVAAPIARAADDRIGYWNLHYWEVGSQNGAPGSPLSRRQANHAVRIIHRWRLEHDPDAPPPTAATGGVAPAVKPITYYIDPSVPERWRSAVKAGVEAWAPAFEQAGFSCDSGGAAGRCRTTGRCDWDAPAARPHVRYSSISWAISMDTVYAVGPHTVDPRSGEILDADIMFAHSWVDHWLGEYTASVADGDGDGHDDHDHSKGGGGRLGARLRRAQAAVDELLEEGRPGGGGGGKGGGGGGAASARRHAAAAAARPGACGAHSRHASHAALAAAAVGNGIEVPESYVLAAIKEVVMHEVGYASRRDATRRHTHRTAPHRSSRSSSSLGTPSDFATTSRARPPTTGISSPTPPSPTPMDSALR